MGECERENERDSKGGREGEREVGRESESGRARRRGLNEIVGVGEVRDIKYRMEESEKKCQERTHWTRVCGARWAAKKIGM